MRPTPAALAACLSLLAGACATSAPPAPINLVGAEEMACADGDAAACERLCERGRANACLTLASRARGGSAQAAMKRTMEAYQRSCDGGDANACGRLGLIVRQQDADRGRELLERACEQRAWEGCLGLLDLPGVREEAAKPGSAAARWVASTRRLLPQACERGDIYACDTLARLRERGGWPFVKELLMAVGAVEMACHHGYERACLQLPRRWEAIGDDLLERKCEERELAQACMLAGRRLESGEAPGEPALEKALGLYRRACELEPESPACREAERVDERLAELNPARRPSAACVRAQDRTGTKGCIEAIAKLGGGADDATLLRELLLADPDGQPVEINAAAADRLGELGVEAAAADLVVAAFLRDSRGRSPYQPARRALARLGAKVAVPPLLAALRGEDRRLRQVLGRQGRIWALREGPELVQLLTDTLDPRAAAALLDGLVLRAEPPFLADVDELNAWHRAFEARRHTLMVGLAPQRLDGKLLKRLAAWAADASLGKAQRLAAAQVLAWSGWKRAAPTLLAVHRDAPDLRGSIAGMLVDSADGSSAAAVAKALGDAAKTPAVAELLALASSCRKATCLLEAIAKGSDRRAAKAALLLSRGKGSQAADDALVARFVRAADAAPEVRRAVLVALARLGDGATGERLLKLAESMSREPYWQREVRIVGLALSHRKP